MEDEIVVSGISGRFPESDNIDQFWTNLIEGVDMVTAGSRHFHLDGLPQRQGKLKTDLTKFDADFFGIHGKQAKAMDPQFRILHEVTFEAIMDAGINPVTIRGSNIGVFVGGTQAQTFAASIKSSESISPYDTTGSYGGMAANRLSFAFDFKGPSYTIDTLCSSSMLALHNGLMAIKAGECNAAIIGGFHTNLHPGQTLQINSSGALSSDGKCKAYDADANGYVRSEAIVSIFLQKKSLALRSYLTCLHSKTNSDGFTSGGISTPSQIDQAALIKSVYSEAKIDPKDVFYVEGHGTGTAVGDPAEMNAISSALLPNRSNATLPLLIGSVKSNMGHSEPASGLCSLVKVILALEHGIIPGNLHYVKPNPKIPALVDGKIQAVSQNTPIITFNKKIIGLNSFGFGGSNVHVIVESKENDEYKIARSGKNATEDDNHGLILFSGRTEENVRFGLEQIKSYERDVGFESLLHSIAKDSIPGHNYRGFMVTENDKTSWHQVNVKAIPKKPPPLWFIFSGMGTVYKGMFDDLMNIQPFADSIEKCNAILSQFGLNVIRISQSEDEKQINQNMGILYGAMQTALIDTMESLGLKPAGMIGHSAGEIICGYADKCLTQEQVLLLFHYKDVCVLNCTGGSMAAVGLTWEETLARLPSDIYAACHNDEHSVTIAGPLNSVTKFVEVLASEGIFAKLIDTGGVAYHSPYLQSILPTYEEYVYTVLEKSAVEKKRSKNWISTCIPEARKDSEEFQTVSSSYIMANIRDPVQFYSATRQIPEGAVILEISSHSLFVSLLRKSLPNPSAVIGLIRKGNGNGHRQLLSAFGQLYQHGYNLDLTSLSMAPTKFPVAVGTRQISSLIKWDHSKTYELMDYNFATSNGGTKIEISLEKEKCSYLKGHKIDSRILFPAAGYLELVWTKFAILNGQSFEKTPVELRDVRFESAVNLQEGKISSLEINIATKNGGAFQITTPEGHLLVKGNIFPLSNTEGQSTDKQTLLINLDPSGSDSDNESGLGLEPSEDIHNLDLVLGKDDIYKVTRLAGYEYDGIFKTIESANFDKGWIKTRWNQNWTAFIDTMFQCTIFNCHDSVINLKIPTVIQNVTIDPIKFLKHVSSKGNLVDVTQRNHLGVIECPGIRINKIKTCKIKRKVDRVQPIIEELKFIPYFDNEEEQCQLSLEEAIKYFTDLILENIVEVEIKIEETVDLVKNAISPLILKAIEFHPLRKARVTINSTMDNNSESGMLEFSNSNEEIKVNQSIPSFNNDVVHFQIINSTSELQNFKIQHSIDNNASRLHFVLFCKNPNDNSTHPTMESFVPVSEKQLPTKHFILYHKKYDLDETPILVHHKDDNFQWVFKLQEILKTSKAEKDDRPIYIISTEQSYSGLVGFINCLRLEESQDHQIHCIASSSASNLESLKPELKRIFEANMVMNIFNKEGKIGSYRHFLQNEGSFVVAKNTYVNCGVKGDLSTLKFYEAPPIPSHLAPHACTVHFSSLNFRDVMLATGKLSQDAIPKNKSQDKLYGAEIDCLLGNEFSGYNQSGEAVMGIVDRMGLATTVIADQILTWKVPERWSMEDAATIPMAYSTAYYALIIRGGGMKLGESILIHSGSGGVGQAAISISLSMNCTVFTTVGSEEKKAFLLQRFPQLQPQNITSSRNTFFEQHISTLTHGRGVDLVLNSLTEEKLDASLRCLAQGGRFLELGKFDLFQNRPLGMEIFLKNISVHGILLDSLSNFPEDKQMVQKLVAKGIKSGVVIPLPHKIFSRTEIEPAFRFMAAGKHIGKVLIQMREVDKLSRTESSHSIEAIGCTYFKPDKVYIIIGGLGGFGFEFARWMIEERGCTKVILVSRTKVKNGYQQWSINNWNKGGGAWVRTEQFDVATLDGANQLIQMALRHGPGIGGIFNLAMVLQDKTFKNQTPDSFLQVCSPKVQTTLNLDILSRKYGLELDYFVTFSSYSAGRGVPGQTNYGYANSCMERICEERRRDGLPGLAIQWGAIGDVGVVFENHGGNEINLHGLIPQKLSSCLSVLDNLLRRSVLTNGHSSSSDGVFTSWTRAKSGLNSSKLQQKDVSGNENDESGIIPMLLRILGLSELPSNTKMSLTDHGLDSLMTVEAKHVLETYFNITFTLDQVRQMSWEKLAEMEVEKSSAIKS